MPKCSSGKLMTHCNFAFAALCIVDSLIIRTFLSIANNVNLGHIYLTGTLLLVENSGPARIIPPTHTHFMYLGGCLQKQSGE